MNDSVRLVFERGCGEGNASLTPLSDAGGGTQYLQNLNGQMIRPRSLCLRGSA